MDSLNLQLEGSSALNYNSVEDIPGVTARAAFQLRTTAVFKEDGDISPVVVNDNLSYMPWGADNQMPYTSFTLSNLTKPSPLANCSMPRYASDRACSITAPKPRRP